MSTVPSRMIAGSKEEAEVIERRQKKIRKSSSGACFR